MAKFQKIAIIGKFTRPIILLKSIYRLKSRNKFRDFQPDIDDVFSQSPGDLEQITYDDSNGDIEKWKISIID